MKLANYTVQLKTIIESLNNYNEELNYQEKINNAIPLFFNFDYSLNEEIKKTFEKKFMLRFYFREIGLETVELFKFKLNMKLNELSPLFNSIYNFYKNVDILTPNYQIEEIEKNGQSNAENQGTSSSNNNGINSDLPQVKINDVGLYANSSVNNYGESKSNATSLATQNERIKRMLKGNLTSKSNYELLKDYINDKIDIDILLLNELEDLFLQIF